jgi:hypothetical protein
LDIKRSLEWLGYIIRIDLTMLGRNVFQSRAESRREVGRIVQRWLEDVENYILELKVKRWSQEANNREELAFVIKEARVFKGL